MQYFCSLFCFTHYPTPVAREPARRKPTTNEIAPVATSVAPTIVSLQSLIVESPLLSQSRGLLHHYALSNPIPLQAPVLPRSVTLCNLPAISTQITPSIVKNTTTSTATGSHPAGNPYMIPIELQHKIVLVPPKPKEMKNKSVWCRPMCQTEPLNNELLKTMQCDAGTSTDEEK